MFVDSPPRYSQPTRYLSGVDQHRRGGARLSAITRYKYQERWGWAIIFGRILVGFLDEHAPTFRPYDLLAFPCFRRDDSRAMNAPATTTVEFDSELLTRMRERAPGKNDRELLERAARIQLGFETIRRVQERNAVAGVDDD